MDYVASAFDDAVRNIQGDPAVSKVWERYRQKLWSVNKEDDKYCYAVTKNTVRCVVKFVSNRLYMVLNQMWLELPV